jgi:hypothetical protein
MKRRKHPHRRKRYVVQLVSEDGSQVLYYNDAHKVWVEAAWSHGELVPTDVYSPRPTVYAERVDLRAATGYANATITQVGG